MLKKWTNQEKKNVASFHTIKNDCYPDQYENQNRIKMKLIPLMYPVG